MIWQYKPVVEEVEESFEVFASDIGDGDRGVVCRPFLGARCLPFVVRLRKGKHIFENPGLRREEVLVCAIQATVDLDGSR
jgi:hypothetical protein